MKIGETVNEHTLMSELGEGVYGKVFKVQNVNTGEVSALKTAKNTGDDTDMQRFDAENTILRTLRPHANILDVFSNVEQYNSDTRYYLMELADDDLINFISNNPHQSFDELIRIFKEIVSGLEHAHNLNISHRDLHFKNVLLKLTQAKLTDFGRAKNFNSKDDFTSREPCWGFFVMPPEIEFNIWQNPTIDNYKLGDMYALGILLFFLFDSVPRVPVAYIKSSIEKHLRQHSTPDMGYTEREELYQTWLSSPWVKSNPSLKVQLLDNRQTSTVNHLLNMLTNLDYAKRLTSVTALSREMENLGL